jgi:hypothetical protein
MNWTSGCSECRQAALKGMSEPLRQIAEAEGPIFLYVCAKCQTLWLETMRFAKPVTRDEAKREFPLYSEQ